MFYYKKNICNILDKPQGAQIFHKLFISIFLLFSATFLIIWSYTWIQNKQYLPLIFTIPFWIFGIDILKKSKFNFKKIIPSILILSILLTGITRTLEEDQTKYSKMTKKQYNELYNDFYKTFSKIYSTNKTCSQNEECN